MAKITLTEFCVGNKSKLQIEMHFQMKQKIISNAKSKVTAVESNVAKKIMDPDDNLGPLKSLDCLSELCSNRTIDQIFDLPR